MLVAERSPEARPLIPRPSATKLYRKVVPVDISTRKYISKPSLPTCQQYQLPIHHSLERTLEWASGTGLLSPLTSCVTLG